MWHLALTFLALLLANWALNIWSSQPVGSAVCGWRFYTDLAYLFMFRLWAAHQKITSPVSSFRVFRMFRTNRFGYLFVTPTCTCKGPSFTARKHGTWQAVNDAVYRPTALCQWAWRALTMWSKTCWIFSEWELPAYIVELQCSMVFCRFGIDRPSTWIDESLVWLDFGSKA